MFIYRFRVSLLYYIDIACRSCPYLSENCFVILLYYFCMHDTFFCINDYVFLFILSVLFFIILFLISVLVKMYDSALPFVDVFPYL